MHEDDEDDEEEDNHTSTRLVAVAVAVESTVRILERERHGDTIFSSYFLSHRIYNVLANI